MSSNERDIIRRLTALEAAAQSVNIIERPDSTDIWTPTFSGSSTNGTYTYSAQAGFYTRIGNQVFIHCRLSISAIAVGPTGSMEIRGLPYTSVSTSTFRSGVYFSLISNFNYTAASLGLQGYILPSETKIHLSESFDNAAQVDAPAANFTNANCALWCSGFYQVG